MEDFAILAAAPVAILAARGPAIPRSRLDDPDLVPYDVFRGDTADKLGDGGFADPRETKLIDAINKLLVVNRAIGDPLGLGDDPLRPGPVAADAGPVPDPAEVLGPNWRDP